MEFRLLGPLEVAARDGPRPLGGLKQRAVLALLLLHANEVLSADTLIDELWGERPPKTAAAYLQNCISRLRKTLGAEALETRPPGYVLRVDPNDVDSLRFERLTSEARALDTTERAPALRSALSLWRGPALADFTLEPFAQVEIGRLEELRLGALENRIDAELELGLHHELVGELDAFAARHPSRERLRELQLLALYRAGRQTDALRAYQEARLALVEELGIEPGERLKALERMILAHDPSLDVALQPAVTHEPVRAARKTVAILLAELLVPDGLDPERSRAVVSRCLAEVSVIVERHGGALEQLLGEEVVAVFGLAAAHEDDALRALRVASEIRDALIRADIGARIGVEAGEMVVGEGMGGMTGSAVSVARRLESRAEPGEILLGPLALRLAAGAIEVVSRDDGAYRLLHVVEGAPAVARRFEAPLAGRKEELGRLRGVFDDAVAGRACRRVLVTGDAGIGKSRLAAELIATLGDRALVLSGQCIPYGEGVTFRPLTEALSAGGELQARVGALLAGDAEAPRVAAVLAAATGASSGPATASEIFWAARRLLEALARQRPVLLLLEDVHWAEPALLDLVEYLAGWSSDSPIVLLCLARPELLEARPEWAEGAVELAPLGEEDARELVEALSERSDLDNAALLAVLSTAEGNPLFLEQLTALAAEQGLAPGAVPPTIEALLGSRLDRLDPGERAVLESAAVAGHEFWRESVDALFAAEERDLAARRLMALVRRRLVRPERSTLLGTDGFRFNHILIRDVAYAGIPKALRATLHEQLARWLDARLGASGEIVGYHLEQAYRYGEELGEEDEALAREAGERLGEAGIRALQIDDRPAAVNLLSRAASLLPVSDRGRLELVCELGLALKGMGEDAQALATLDEAADLAQTAGDVRLELRARVEQAWPRLLRGTAGADETLAQAERAIQVFEEQEDDRGLARAWQLVGAVRGPLQGCRAASAEAVSHALSYYRATDFAARGCFSMLAAAAWHGPEPVDEAIGRCARLLADDRIDRGSRADVLSQSAPLEAYRGCFDQAREQLSRARETYAEPGHGVGLAADWAYAAARVEQLAGDHGAAEVILRDGCKTLERHGDRAWLATHLAVLSEVLYAQGRHSEALDCADEAMRLAPIDDLTAQVLWRRARARAFVRDDREGDSERLVREALELLEPTDELSAKGEAQLDLAEVLALSGRGVDAQAAARRGLQLLEEKGNDIVARRAQMLLEELGIGAAG